jgi:hypothetical protein
MAKTDLARRLVALDRSLVRAGFPALTAWWTDVLSAFLRSAKRQLVIRAGRRGGKSTSLVRALIVLALYGEHEIPPGDVGVVAIISVNRDEAAQRLRLVKAILDALDLGWKPIDGGLELEGRPIAFKVYAASVSGVSGFTCIGALCDEAAKWRDADTGANPATQVLASLRPTMAGQRAARLFLSSSPMGRQDAHAKAFDEGDTDFQSTAVAATWVARPELTEAECHELEPDPDTFQREYGAIPFDGTTQSLFTEQQLLAVTRRGDVELPARSGRPYFAAQDPASPANAWSLCVCHAEELGDQLFSIVVDCCLEWRAPRGGALDSDVVFAEIANVLGAYGCTELWSDQWSFDSLKTTASRHGLELRLAASTQTTKVSMYDAFRRRVADRTTELPDIVAVRSDLLGVRKWISKGGAFSIELERQGPRHSDFAPAVVLATWKASEDVGALPAWARPEAQKRMADIVSNGPAALMTGNDYCFDPADHWTQFGQRKKPAAELEHEWDEIGKLGWVAGVGTRFPRSMRSSFGLNRETTFTAGATQEFRDAVAQYRTAHQI